jgi:hypothetical protein
MEKGSIWAIVVPKVGEKANVKMQHWVDGDRVMLTPEQGLKLTMYLIGGFLAFEFVAFFWALFYDKPSKPKLDREEISEDLFRSVILGKDDLGPLKPGVATKKSKVQEPTFEQLVSEQSMTSSVNLGTSYKSAVVNKEEMTLQEFKKAMMKQSSMTLEEFYRCIDKTYSMSITVK